MAYVGPPEDLAKRRPGRNIVRILAIYVVVLVSLTAVISGVQALYLAQKNHQFSERLRAGSIKSCERQNEIRRAVRELAQQTNEGLRSISPNVPPSPESQQVIQDRQELRQRFQPVMCDVIYPNQ